MLDSVDPNFVSEKNKSKTSGVNLNRQSSTEMSDEITIKKSHSINNTNTPTIDTRYLYIDIAEIRNKKNAALSNYKLCLYLDKTCIWHVKLPLDSRNTPHVYKITNQTQIKLKLIKPVDILKSHNEVIRVNIPELKEHFPYRDRKSFCRKDKKTKNMMHVKFMLMKQKIQVDPQCFLRPAHYFISNDNLEGLEIIDFMHFNDADDESQYPLFFAIKSNKVECAEIIINRLNLINKPIMKMSNNTTVLHYAAKYIFDQDDFSRILKHSTDIVEVRDTVHDRTALHSAARYNNAAAIKLLIEAGASIDSVDNTVRTALMHSIEGSNINAMEMLLSMGADIYQKNKKITPWQMAVILKLCSHETKRRFMEVLNVDHPNEFKYRKRYANKECLKLKNLSHEPCFSNQVAIRASVDTKCVIFAVSDGKDEEVDTDLSVAFLVSKSHQVTHNEPAYTQNTILCCKKNPLVMELKGLDCYHIIPFIDKIPQNELKIIRLTREDKNFDFTVTRPWFYHCRIEDEWTEFENLNGYDRGSKGLRCEIAFASKNQVYFSVLISQGSSKDYSEEPKLEQFLNPKQLTVGFDLFSKKTSKHLERPVFSNARDVHAEYVSSFEEDDALIIMPLCLSSSNAKFCLTVFCDERIELLKCERSI